MIRDAFVEQFTRVIERGELSHAYLFFGEASPEEKFNAAHALAHVLEHGSYTLRATAPLSECFVLTPGSAGAVGIDEVRVIQDFLYRAPVFSKRRMVIIQGADTLTPQSQHAILKILEEPPASSLLIFIAAREESLLPTVLSRMQRIHFTESVPPAGGSDRVVLTNEIIEDIIGGDDPSRLDVVFRDLLRARTSSLPATTRHHRTLREIMRRYSALKQFNVNTRLQLRALQSFLGPRDN